MASSLTPSRLIGNLAAIAILPLGAAFLWDQWIASWFGYQPTAMCTIVGPVVNVAGSVGVLLTTLGVVSRAVSRFRSETGVALIIGGVALFLAPAVLPHYLGATCIP